MNNLLKEGIERGFVKETGQIKKMRIDGREEYYPVYAIKLDLLFYNDKNDRIASWVSKYNDSIKQKFNNKEEFNKLIEKLIVESNESEIKKTERNIELIGQREPGVVLNDGRVIDGNRRFTCLRRLAKKNDSFNYFEAIILNYDLNTSPKVIKILELQLQHGVEERIDYNPIDKLVGVYKDIVEEHLLTAEEYARSTNQSLREINEKIQLSKLMVEFLEFINAEKEFYIARELDLDGPLHELYGLLKKVNNEDEKEDWKNVVFANLIMKPSTDMTKYTRDMKKINQSEFKNDFLEEQIQISMDVFDDIQNLNEEITPEIIRTKIRTNEKKKSLLMESKGNWIEKINIKNAKNAPLCNLNKSINYLEDIDLNILSNLKISDINEFKERYNVLIEKINEIGEIINV